MESGIAYSAVGSRRIHLPFPGVSGFPGNAGTEPSWICGCLIDDGVVSISKWVVYGVRDCVCEVDTR